MKSYGLEGGSPKRNYRWGPPEPRTKPNGYTLDRRVWNRLGNAEKYARAKERRRDRVCGRRMGQRAIEESAATEGSFCEPAGVCHDSTCGSATRTSTCRSCLS